MYTTYFDYERTFYYVQQFVKCHFDYFDLLET